jgi:Zn-dependent protease
MFVRENANPYREIKDLMIADIVLIVAFSFTLLGGVFGFFQSTSSIFSSLITTIPIVALAVTLSFVLHELMHKFVAQHYGAIAGFRTSYNGLAITFMTGLFGFLLGIPGATVIYTSSFTKRQNGLVSLAGPLTNFAVFVVFVGLGIALFGFAFLANPPANSYIYNAISLTLFISILLAFFNMLPIFPLDGSKVLSWNKPVYVGTMALIFVLMLVFTHISLIALLFMLGIALLFSLFYRRI